MAYYNSYYAPVARWERDHVPVSSAKFTANTNHMVLLSTRPGLTVKPTPHPVNVWKWVKGRIHLPD